MISVSSPLEFTALASFAQASGYFIQSAQLSAATSNTNDSPVCLPGFAGQGPSVDSTVQFIRANYDDLFKRLAD
jgi:hypothetical protein